MNHTDLLSISQGFLKRLHLLREKDIEPLREVIQKHNALYYQSNAPIISDREYDLLFHALARLEADYDRHDPTSPTAHIAVLLSEQFRKVKHRFPMISLDNTYSIEDVRDFEKRIFNALKSKPELSYCLELKFDGLGLALIYKEGNLTQAITRGSGVEGEDVSVNAFEIKNIPHFIEAFSSYPEVEVRGEVVMSHEAFIRTNKERSEVGERLFANPRNAASGSLRQLDPLITRKRELEFYAYAMPDHSLLYAFVPDLRYSSFVAFLSEIGLATSIGSAELPLYFKRLYGIDALIEEVTTFTENRFRMPFDIDGLVIKLDDLRLWDTLGTTEHHPRYAIAYKFPATQVRTRILSIEHSVGRSGIVTPVANLEGVNVGGVIVRRATLHNYDELRKKDVRVGDYVYIVRAGEVIPEVIAVIPEVRTGEEIVISPPLHCPVCNTGLLQNPGKVAIFCPNRYCPAQILGRLEVFVGKQGLNIDGLGTKQLELFLEKGWITDYASVFHLVKYKEELLTLGGYKSKSIDNLEKSLAKARNTSLDRILVALGIPNLGKKTAKIIAKYITEKIADRMASGSGKDESIVNVLSSLPYEEILSLHDIGPETARSFTEFVEENLSVIEGLFHELIIDTTNSNPSHVILPLHGKSFCVTGTFSELSRDEIHILIEENGGEVRSSVSPKLDYLIAGESAGSKLSKAQELQIKVISLKELEDILN